MSNRSTCLAPIFKDLKIPTANDRWFTGEGIIAMRASDPARAKKVCRISRPWTLSSAPPMTRTAVLVAWRPSQGVFNCTIVFFLPSLREIQRDRNLIAQLRGRSTVVAQQNFQGFAHPLPKYGKGMKGQEAWCQDGSEAGRATPPLPPQPVSSLRLARPTCMPSWVYLLRLNNPQSFEFERNRFAGCQNI